MIRKPEAVEKALRQQRSRKRGQPQLPASAKHFAKPGNGRSDKSQHDQRYAEGNDLAQNVLDSNCDIENCHGDSVGAVPVQDKPGYDPQDHSNQQLKWQTVEKDVFSLEKPPRIV